MILHQSYGTQWQSLCKLITSVTIVFFLSWRFVHCFCLLTESYETINQSVDQPGPSPAGGPAVPGPPIWNRCPTPFHVWPTGCCIHPMLYCKNVAPPSGFRPLRLFLAPLPLTSGYGTRTRTNIILISTNVGRLSFLKCPKVYAKTSFCTSYATSYIVLQDVVQSVCSCF